MRVSTIDADISRYEWWSKFLIRENSAAAEGAARFETPGGRKSFVNNNLFTPPAPK